MNFSEALANSANLANTLKGHGRTDFRADEFPARTLFGGTVDEPGDTFVEATLGEYDRIADAYERSLGL